MKRTVYLFCVTSVIDLFVCLLSCGMAGHLLAVISDQNGLACLRLGRVAADSKLLTYVEKVARKHRVMAAADLCEAWFFCSIF